MLHLSPRTHVHAQVRHYLKDPSKVTRDSFKTMCLLGNPGVYVYVYVYVYVCVCARGDYVCV